MEIFSGELLQVTPVNIPPTADCHQVTRTTGTAVTVTSSCCVA